MKVTTQKFMKFFVWLLVFVVVAPFIFIGGNIALDIRAGGAFNKVTLGSSERPMEVLMGKPSRKRACGENLAWRDEGTILGKNDGRCLTESRYE